MQPASLHLYIRSNRSMANDSIFEEEATVHDPVRQKRYWRVLVVLFIACTAFVSFAIVRQIVPYADAGLSMDNVKLLYWFAEIAFMLAALILFLLKSRLGWITATLFFAFMAALCLILLGYFVYAHMPL